MTSSVSSSSSPLLASCALLLLMSAGCAQVNGVPQQPGEAMATARVAVMPVENASRGKAPLARIRGMLGEKLSARGVSVIETATLERVLDDNRVRYTAGIEDAVARALREQTGAGAVLLTTVSLYSDAVPPQIALISRLVSTGSPPEILGAGSVSLVGDDEPGLLGLGIIDDPDELLSEALDRLLDSFECCGTGGGRAAAAEPSSWARLLPWRSRFEPQSAYRRKDFGAGAGLRVAVVPFSNPSEHPYAGRIMELLFVNRLAVMEEFSVVEPGRVREAMLEHRVIQPESLSLENAATLLDGLGVDLVVGGTVLEFKTYEESPVAPRVDFSALVIDKKGDAGMRTTVWSSHSYGHGDDGVYFYDVGKQSTADAMASQMIRVLAHEMIRD